MDEFFVYGSTFDSFLENLDIVMKYWMKTNFVLNWEKCHFMAIKSIILGHQISNKGNEVDWEKVEVIEKLSPPTNIKGI